MVAVSFSNSASRTALFWSTYASTWLKYAACFSHESASFPSCTGRSANRPLALAKKSSAVASAVAF
eukprot:2564629-Pyramimonas_sp.AAC.1